MAKDGTNRGGPRANKGGRPKKALCDKILEGTAEGTKIIPKPADLIAFDAPPVKEFMKDAQRDGDKLYAEQIYKETFQWLAKRNCETLVNPELVELYSMAVARWIQCEKAISMFGLLAKHPTTDQPIQSPYMSMSRDCQKQITASWYQIYSIVRENSEVSYSGPAPHNDMMERLLAD